MIKYHFIFKENPQEFYSKGINILADTPLEAMKKFFESQPVTIIFLSMYVVKEFLY